MATEQQPLVPTPLREVIGEEASAQDGFTMLLLTVGTDGFPHQTMLSYGEVVPTGEDLLSFAVWAGSSVVEQLRANPKATITAVIDGVGWTLLLETTDEGEITPEGSKTLHHFTGKIVKVTADSVPYARLESGVVFRLVETGGVVERWQATRAILKGGSFN